jgi:carbohydrate-selective porin OprB
MVRRNEIGGASDSKGSGIEAPALGLNRSRYFSKELRRAQQNGQLPGPPGGQDYEMVIELTYRFDLRKGALFIQPDLQYIIQPGGTSRLANAIVLGAQFGINF